MKLLTIVFTILFCPISPVFAGSPWGSVEKILGVTGREQGGWFLLEIPRTDLNVTVQGVPLEPGLALTHRIYFKPLEKGTSLMGDLVLLEQEVPTVTALLAQNGFQSTEPHAFLWKESPVVKMLHLKGQGSRVNLALALKRVLSAKPLTENSMEPTKDPKKSAVTPTISPLPTQSATPSNPQAGAWDEIQGLLGQGELSGKVLRYQFDSRITPVEGDVEIPSYIWIGNAIRFQKIHGAARGENSLWGFGKGGLTKDFVVAAGQLWVPRDRLDSVKEILAKKNIEAPNAWSPDPASTGTVLYLWAMGPSRETAQAFQAVLALLEPGKSK